MTRRSVPVRALAGIALGTALFAGALQAGPAARVTMGASLLAYGLLGLANVTIDVPPRAERLLSPLVGLVNGAVTAATGTFVLPSVPFLQSIRLGREELIQALGLSFTVSTVALAAALAGHGQFGRGALLASLGALVPALAGMQLGTWLRGRVRPATFRRAFFAGTAALGLHLAVAG